MLSPTDKGIQTEAIILAELVKRGFSVLMPFGNAQRYDFVIDMQPGFIRVQCKTGRLRNGAIVFSTASLTKNWLEKSTTHKSYSEQIDYFVVYCPDNQKLYRIPISEASTGQMKLRIERPKNNQDNGIKWARWFDIDGPGEKMRLFRLDKPSGHNSVVECLVANENAVSSNLTVRS